MDFIQLGADRLKIMLSRADMDEYSIDCDSMDYGDTGTRRAFWSILDEAKRETGFNAASGRAYIQVYRSREGGCELFVTMLSCDLEDASSDGFSLSYEEGSPEGRSEAFYFESIDEIAFRFSFTPSKVKMMLKRTRDRLKDYLIGKGVLE